MPNLDSTPPAPKPYDPNEDYWDPLDEYSSDTMGGMPCGECGECTDCLGNIYQRHMPI
jgi:hypothetical protein